ncbi:MAG: glutamate racemase [Clostridia bacterium]
MKIGVCDSGVGGLTVLKEMESNFPNNEYIYLADLKNCPFGPKSFDEIEKILYKICDFFVKQNVDLIVIACGTLSSVTQSLNLNSYKQIPIIDVVQSVSEEVNKRNYEKIVLLATESTIKQETFKNSILKSNNKIEIEGIACTDFVPIIENGFTNSNLAMNAVLKYLNFKVIASLINKPSAIILGCTHYPLLKDCIEKVTFSEKNNIDIIEPGKCVASYINEKIKLKESLSSLECYVTLKTETFETIYEEIIEKGKKITEIEL